MPEYPHSQVAFRSVPIASLSLFLVPDQLGDLADSDSAHVARATDNIEAIFNPVPAALKIFARCQAYQGVTLYSPVI